MSDKPNGYVPAAGLFTLSQACVVVHWAFDSVPYLVGSALERRDYRDVDVRVLLDDGAYAQMFPGPGHQWTQPFWSLLCSAISRHLSHASGLPIDFQVQAMTKANEQYGNQRRVPLGIYPTAPPDEGTGNE